MKHGSEGKIHLVVEDVDNPFRKGEKESVVKNARESNAKTLRLDPAQTEAFDRVWELYYKMGHYRQGAVDPSNEPVDNQQTRDPITETVVDASRKINSYREALGEDWVFIDMTCLSGLNYRDVAGIMFGSQTRRCIDESAWIVKGAYSKLCVEMNLAETRDKRVVRRLRAWSDSNIVD